MKCGKSCLLNIAKHRHSSSLKCGFTIVELLVVIVVIGILAAITIVSYTGISQKATVASLTSDLTNASKQLKLFQVENSNYPTTIDCTIPDSTTNKCVKLSGSTTYQYNTNSSSSLTFCINATKSAQTYSIAQDGILSAGACPTMHLDAGNSASYPGTGSVWSNLISNGNNGTLMNGVAYSSANGGVLSFDGVNDYVSIPTLAANSVEMWVKPSSSQTATYPTYYNQYSQNTSTGFWWVYSEGAGTDLKWQFANGTASVALSWDGAITYNAWNYFVFVYDNTAKTVTLYKNGVSFGVKSCPNALLPSGTFHIGSYQGSANTHDLNSLVGDFRIHGRALATAEVTQNFNALRGRYGL